MTIYYKCLTADGRGPYSDRKWSLPILREDGTYKPGRWMPRIKDELVRCEVGYHGCTRDNLLRWLNETIYVMEFDGEPESDDEKCWGARARLLYPLTNWTERTARLCAADCAEMVLPLFEKGYPNDKRPREAIAAARRYATGDATRAELAAARDAARAAAEAAAWAAAEAAAWAAARAAAEAAAWAAAEAAARAAAWAAARAAAEALFDYLEGRKG